MPADWQQQREEMVRAQLIRRQITDERVLAAMRRVPRELFIPFDLRSSAYDDCPMPIGLGQTISQPYMVAAMAELLALSPPDRLLDIGTGSGYAAAVLSLLCSHVWSVELLPELADSAAGRLSRLGFANISVRCADGYLGWPEQAPFDAIHVAAAARATPPVLLEQLGPAGRLVIPLGKPRSSQTLKLYQRTAEGITDSSQGLVEFVELKSGRPA